MRKASQGFVGRLGQLRFRSLHSHCLTLGYVVSGMIKKGDKRVGSHILPDIPPYSEGICVKMVRIV